MRRTVPHDAHSQYAPSPKRPDPIALLQSQDAVRIQSLVPIRFGRMAASPFSFYRGAAIVMANDLATTPTTGWLPRPAVTLTSRTSGRSVPRKARWCST